MSVGHGPDIPLRCSSEVYPLMCEHSDAQVDELGGRLAEAHAQGTPQQLQEAERRVRAAQAACARKVRAQSNKTQSTAKISPCTSICCIGTTPAF